MPFPDHEDWLGELQEVWSEIKAQPGDGGAESNAWRMLEPNQPPPELVWHRAIWYLAIQRVTQNPTPYALKNFIARKYWNTDWEAEAKKDLSVQKAMKPVSEKLKENNAMQKAIEEYGKSKSYE